MYFILSVWLHHVCLAHTHKLGDAHATHSPPTHIHVCSETFYFMWLPAHDPLSKCVCEWESASVSCPLANIACPSRPTFVYARMRYAGHTSNVCGILGQLKSFKTLDTNRLAPLYVCLRVCVCSCVPVGVRLDGHISLADILMQIAFLIFLVFLFSIEPQEKTKSKYGKKNAFRIWIKKEIA